MKPVAHALSKLALAAVLFGAVASTTGCYGYDDTVAGPADYPPDSYIATVEPVYFGGHAAYWYGGRWVYRDGGRWGYYGHEPRELAARRGGGGYAPSRHYYEHGGAARGGGRGGRGGGRR